MKREKLEKALELQKEKDFPLQGEELEEAQQLINNIASTQRKIADLKLYIESDKERLKDMMIAHNVDEVWATKGRARVGVSDVTKIVRDKVLAVIDEFRRGEREDLEFKDVSVTQTQETFRVIAHNVEGDEM